MNTNQLKIFATKAREILRRGVMAKLRWLGFDEQGVYAEAEAPKVFAGGTAWRGAVYGESFGRQWEALAGHIKHHGVRETVEEGAYTWFNRLMAIHILAKNNLCEPILDYADNGLPRLVEDAHMGRVPEMTADRRDEFDRLLEDPSKVDAQFALLISEWCRTNPIVNACFGSIDSYVELLLPNDILGENNFLRLLNTTVNLTDEDYRSSELIGWLYQFYISDRKDEVFAKKGKVEADEIPAATQIFTPNWIVKYMLQNSVLPQFGITEGEYLVKNEDSTAEPRFSTSELESFKVADLACGSGHIIGEAFDMLYDLYMDEGYMPDEAVEAIFRRNLLGIDIDLRARQLAMFALMLKAAQRDEELALAPILPRVLTIPAFVDMLGADYEEGSQLPQVMGDFYRDSVTADVARETEATFAILKDARSLGSIMKFDISPSTRRALADTATYWEGREPIERPFFVRLFLPAANLILALTDSYDAIVMNPPYMATGKTDGLKEYATKNYPDSKPDLFSVFMDVCIDRLKDGGKYGMINMQSWMFLSSFEALRKRIIDTQQIDSLLHLGPRTFDELSGEVVQNAAFVISKSAPSVPGIYYRLIDGKNCNAKREMFLANDNRYVIADQKQFEQIPGSPIAYWVSEKVRETFLQKKPLRSLVLPSIGMMTWDNNRFLRNWYEIDPRLINFNCKSVDESISSGFKWFPYNKGGSGYKWYGLYELVVNWKNAGEEIANSGMTSFRGKSNYFKEGITYPRIGSANFSARWTPSGSIFDINGPSCFPEQDLSYLLSFMNSIVMKLYLSILCPGLTFQVGDIFKVPFIVDKLFSSEVSKLANSNISISKEDWDAHETSWDFQRNELLTINAKNCFDIVNEYCDAVGVEIDMVAPEPNKLEWLMGIYEMKWEAKLRQLHANEEELNRQFIEIYGLQDELTPDVPLDEVTILQQGEVKIEDGELKWQRDVVMRQLISYIVGCYMGRYRLDRPGLAIAHPEPTADELGEYQFGATHTVTFTIDDDAIIPILDGDAPFYDNLSNYVKDFVRMLWEEEDLNENLNFMEQCLGKSIEDYLSKDFWKDHKKMYQNRPIYWLFSSKKGAFKCIVYAHRMTKHTVALIRTKYLLRYITHLEEKETAMASRYAELSTRERKELERLRKDIDECKEYQIRVEAVADRSIAFDLDAGIPANHALFGDIAVKLK